MRRLAAIAAIFRTSACLDAEKPAELDLVGIEILAVHGLRLKQKVVEGRVMERPSLFQGPLETRFDRGATGALFLAAKALPKNKQGVIAGIQIIYTRQNGGQSVDITTIYTHITH